MLDISNVRSVFPSRLFFTLARLDEPPTDSVYISHCDIGDGCGAGGRGIMGIIGVGGGNICCCCCCC